ncbi:hypothetical protein JK636_07445 [Clostridium sp. YIM B02515]|uniref:Uncharacterized protein n=1 Tax=Clostridium rhizosphaerae TaxID=2803861 RepID=A0ABS1T907_9CLOT|nr:hypothetical protein [Clostridium rhizosphaerae]MBL4935592.1 hypothetical protein [Clostridium rhizosphaerae]
MKKKFIAYFLLTVSLAVSSQFISKNLRTSFDSAPVTYLTSEQDAQISAESQLLANQQIILAESANIKDSSTSDAQDTKPAPALSRGGTGLSKSQAVSSEKSVVKKQNSAAGKSGSTTQTTASSNVQLLDWWKSGQFTFSIGTVAEVKDFYTGKTFMVKRTMGTNHADSEALTKKDTDIIKSIWGGFSWNRRPVILTIGGKRYAASMSAMPHAGLDSAPEYATINNRSEGYGTGQNLDVIKGNGMDGHFDIHFLNSTRHKDGQKDPQHQAALLVAAGK